MWAERGKARPAHAHSARRPRQTAARTAAIHVQGSANKKKDVAKKQMTIHMITGARRGWEATGGTGRL